MIVYSHTLVRNGQPFIDLVLRQAEPYVDKMFITVSGKSLDGTINIVEKFKEDFSSKVVLDYENIGNPAELTKERQKQIDRTPTGVWILFLDDDDYWFDAGILRMREILEEYPQVAGFGVRPLQIIDRNNYDSSWGGKFFTKWFRKQTGLHYRGPWPKDLIYLNDTMLYWKKTPLVKRVMDFKYLHLSNIKYSSFRTQPEFKQYETSTGPSVPIPGGLEEDMNRIYECYNKWGKNGS